MAEAIGIVGSIIAILQLSGTAIGYLREVKNRDCPRLRSSLRTTEGVLKTLQETVNDAQADPQESWSKTIEILDEPGGPLPQLKDVVSSINIILQKHATGPRKFLWPFKKDEVDELVGTMKGLESLIQLALANDHIALTKEVQRNIESIKQGVDNLRVAQDKSLALENDHITLSKAIQQDTEHISSGVDTLRISQDNALALEKDHIAISKAVQEDAKVVRQGVEKIQISAGREDVLTWLSTLDPTLQLHDFLSKRTEGSGQWFLASDEFRTWLAEPGKTLLCPGLPGAGKTVMASMAVEHLIDKYVANDSLSFGVACFLCSYQPQKVQGPENLLLCLLRQLVQRLPQVPDSVVELYRSSTTRGIRPSLKEIMDVLHSTILRFKRVFIVLDALDEYYDTDSGSLSLFLSKLFEVQNWGVTNILATSRFNAEVTTQFPQGVLTREIRADDEDVLRYINSRIPSLLSSRISRNPEVIQLIRDEVLKRVDGMFLLSRLHMDALASQPSVGHIKRTLKDLPKGIDGLDQTYENALQRIKNQAPEQRELANKVLSWLFQAKRALSTAELQHALATEPGRKDLDEDFLPAVELLDALCAGLVTVDQEADVVRLVHYTTREYFERHDLLRGAHYMLAETCITYLSFDGFASGVCPDISTFRRRGVKYKLLDYATTYWGEHLRSCIAVEGYESSLLVLALQFLGNPKLADSTFQYYLLDHGPYYYSLMSRVYMTTGIDLRELSGTTGLHLAAYLGLDFLVGFLLKNNARRDARDSRGWTPIAWAVWERHYRTVKLLLESPDPKDFGKDLLSSSEECHADVEHSLNLMDNVGRTPFFYAVKNGYHDIADLLLDNGADGNLAGDGVATPLEYVISNGSVETFRYLVSKVVVDKSNLGGSPSSRGHIVVTAGQFRNIEQYVRMLQILLDPRTASENINSSGQTSYSSNHSSQPSTDWGIDETNRNLMRLKDEAGTTLALPSNKRRLDEILASARRAGAGLDGFFPQANLSQRLIRLAICAKSSQAVKALLHSNPELDINCCPDKGCSMLMTTTSLYAATDHEQKALQEITIALLDAGARVDDKDDGGCMAMHFAADRGHSGLMRVLREYGAALGDHDTYLGATPLILAVESMELEAVRFLLRQGVDKEAMNHEGKTALMRATEKGWGEGVTLLLNSGANVETTSSGFPETALTIATGSQQKGIAKQLVVHGASLEAMGRDGFTPLLCAVRFWRPGLGGLSSGSRG